MANLVTKTSTNLKSTFNSFGNFISNFFGLSTPGKVEDSGTYNGWITDEGYYTLDDYRDNLSRLYEPLKGLQISRRLCRQLDEAVGNDPIISACHEKLMSIADTKFEIILETKNKGTAKKALEQLKEELPKLFYTCTSIKDVSQFIISRLITYGYFACQLWPDENLTTLEEIIIPQPYSIKWMRVDNKWQLVQYDRGRLITINRELFVYEPLMAIQNNDGIWPVPLFKAALHPLHAYELFIESLAQIARRTGMQKIIAASLKVGEKLKVGTPGTNEFRKAMVEIQNVLDGFMKMIRKTLPSGVVAHPDSIELKELATVEPPAHLIAFHDLLATQVVLGCKLYPALVGVVTKENQTTLSTNQKLALKSLVTTIQSKTDAAMLKAIKEYLIFNGYIVKNIEIKREPPQMESSIDDANARLVNLQADQLEKTIEKENVVLSDQGTIENSGAENKEEQAEETEAEENTESNDAETEKPKTKPAVEKNPKR